MFNETTTHYAERLEYNQLTPLVAVNFSFNAIVRTYSNDTATLYIVNSNKDDESIRRDGVIPRFYGILAHDHDKKYYKYGTQHTTCGTHLSRELKACFCCMTLVGLINSDNSC
ncbi:MAG: hypothetical protein FWH37_08035 [Candidatus Bathyarchaeota archaeon]|nr:hypothetical protein [Candidatus Termiticorpusculum sp.]